MVNKGLVIGIIAAVAVIIIIIVVIILVMRKPAPPSVAPAAPNISASYTAPAGTVEAGAKGPLVPAEDPRVRYVELFQPDGYINVMELEVIKDGTNIALNKPIVEATPPYNDNYLPQYINDGNVATTYYHSEGGKDQKIIIDLQQDVSLPLSVIIYNRINDNMCCADRIVGSQVILLNPNMQEVASRNITQTLDTYNLQFA